LEHSSFCCHQVGGANDIRVLAVIDEADEVVASALAVELTFLVPPGKRQRLDRGTESNVASTANAG